MSESISAVNSADELSKPPECPIILASSNKIPEAVLEQLQAADGKFEDIFVAAEADLSFTGEIMPLWLLGTWDKIYVFPAVKGLDEPRIFKYEEIDRMDLRGTVGSTSLRIKVEGFFLDLIRFTNNHRERFARVLIQLRRLKEKKSFQPEALTAPDSWHCQQCSLPLPEKDAPCPRCMNQGDVLWRTLAMMRPYYGWVALLLVVIIFGIGLDLIPPLLTKMLVDDVLNVESFLKGGESTISVLELSSRQKSLLLIVGALLGAALLRMIVNIVVNRISAFVGTRLTSDMRRRLFDKLTSMTVDYYDRNQVGSLMSRITGDVEVLHGFVGQAAQGFLLNILLIVGIGAMLFYLSPTLALFVLIPIPFVVGGTLYFWKKIYPRYFKLWDSNSKLSSMLNGVFSGIRLVKAFSQEARETERFQENINYLRDSRKTLDSEIGTFNPIMAFLFGLGGFIVWFVGGREVLTSAGVESANQMTLGKLIAYLSYIAMFYGPLTNLTMFSNWISGFVTASHRIFEVLDSQPSLHDKENAPLFGEVEGNIEFQNVTFGYDPYNPILHNVSLKMEAGKMVGIVGRSGSGKTTLINLLCRFYDPQEGAVLLDGKDLRDMRRDDLRKHIGLVLQEPFLFRDTVAANISYGKPDASDILILNAAKAANAHDFIMRLPSGYDTRLGERGAGLSGGERQRVSIARALLCDPAILILDEATSSVDTESEQKIQEALSILCKGRTTIAIAHRLSTLRDADKIFVIDHGRVVEEGSHEELMALEGIYHRLVKIQTQLTALED